MKIFTACEGLSTDAQGAVTVIGNFDGVHRGHRALLTQARKKANAEGVPLGVLTFEPHPRRLFRPDDPPFRITPAPLKREQLAQVGVDILYVLPFDWDFASQSAEHFVNVVLCRDIQPLHVMVGDDFRFGQLRRGDPSLMRAAGLSVTVLEKMEQVDDAPISASRIREMLCAGNISRANDLLGWAWEIDGPVVPGDKRGRTLGYPTANVRLEETIHPAYGIYASLAQIEGEEGEAWIPSVTNIGIRPMFEVSVGQVETHIFDFDRDIYGRTLRVRPVVRLRGEARFDTIEELIGQIERDCIMAREVLSVRNESAMIENAE